MSEPTKAVFLSYAREDADAARRIADALRSQGVEVWFDQSELRGGEAWDAKIKKQIRECALFMAVVSNSTQERTEGYFRREWLLAVERTRDMAAGVAFVVPVVIDETLEAEAVAPEEFMRVQWMRLPGALPTPDFVTQMKNLLGGGRKRLTIAPMSTGQTAAPMRTRPPMTALPPLAPKPPPSIEAPPPPKKKSGRRTGLWVGLLVVLLAGGAGAYFFLLQPEPAPPPPKPVVAAKPKPVPVAPVAPPEPVITDKSIAVLPFENMSEDKDANAFFADGIHEDILTNLAHIRELRVVSRTSVMEYRGAKENLRVIAQKLGVAYILEGSVRRAGGKVRVTGQLIRAATDEHVWAQDYTKDLTAADVFAIQTDLAEKIAASLQAVLSPQEKKLLGQRPTENTAAYDAYLKARAERRAATGPDGLVRQEEFLLTAVKLDQNFAAAWAELTIVHADNYNLNRDHSETRLASAKAAIDQAVRLAPDSPEVIRALGELYFHGYRDFARATEQFQKLIQLQPNDPNAYSGLGFVQRRQGRWKEALANFLKTMELDPGDSRVANTGVLQLLRAGRRYEELAAQRRRFNESHTVDSNAVITAIDVFLATGSTHELSEALASADATPSSRRGNFPTHRELAQWKGDRAEAIRVDRQSYPDENSWPTDPIQALESAALRKLGGDEAGAQAMLQKPLAALKSRLEVEPANADGWAQRGQLEAVLGHRDEALRCAQHAVELVPESVDAFDGPRYACALAFVYAWTGDKGRALALYAHLLRTPYSAVRGLRTETLNVFVMKHAALYQPLQGDPRFDALLNDPKNNAPLF